MLILVHGVLGFWGFQELVLGGARDWLLARALWSLVGEHYRLGLQLGVARARRSLGWYWAVAGIGLDAGA